MSKKLNHELTFRRESSDEHGPVVYIATLRFDDRFGNGHKTFSLTGEEYRKEISSARGPTVLHEQTKKKLYLSSCGCLHDMVRSQFPELAHLIKWHLVSTDGPIHYFDNTQYHAKEGNLEAARSSAVSQANLDQLSDPQWLKDRLPRLMKVFRKDMEDVGFDYDEE